MKYSASMIIGNDMLEYSIRNNDVKFQDMIVKSLFRKIEDAMRGKHEFDVIVRGFEQMGSTEIKVSLHCLNDLEYRTLKEKANAYDRLLANKIQWGIQ